MWLSWDWRPATLAVVPTTERPQPAALVEAARNFLGTPYRWGGVGNPGFDCSGFINKVYALHGYDLPRVSREQFLIGKSVPRDQLGTGDLLFFSKEPGDSRITHVGMYVDDAEFIHAAIGKGEVTYDLLTSRYYSARLVGARRVLALPPGRYSTERGTALVKPVSESAASPPKPQEEARLVGQTEPPPPPPGDEPAEGVVDAALVEHVEERPPYLAPEIVKGAVTHVGPHIVSADATELGMRMGVTHMADDTAMLLVPEARYFGHADALRVDVAVPLRIPGDGDFAGANRAHWASWRDYTRVLREITYGQKEAKLYLDLSRTSSGSLGHGQLMRYFTPNIASRDLPQYVLASNALSLSADGWTSTGGGEVFIDDVTDPVVMGVMGFARPTAITGGDDTLLRSISAALTYVVDRDAPFAARADGSYSRRAVHGLGADVEIKPIKAEALDLKLYVDASSLLWSGGAGVGSAVGTLLRSNLAGQALHVVRLRLEGRASSATFIPTYFDTTYALNRYQAPVDRVGDTPLTKLGLLEALEGTAPRWGVYGEATYHYARRASFGLAYEDGGAMGSLPASERYTGRSLMLFTQLRNFYLPGSSRKVSGYIAYHRRNFASLMPLLGLSRANEYLFATTSVELWRYLSVGASVRKAFDVASASGAAFDAALDVTFRYEM